MKSITRKIISNLNESISNPVMESDGTTVENELDAEVNVPKQLFQCDNCAEFYVGTASTNESVDCPFCDGKGHKVGDISLKENDAEVSEEDTITEEEENELRSEAEVVVTEALKILDRNDYRKFNESYRPRTRVTSKGELEVLVESSKGGFVTAKRRMTSRQKTAYNLSENYKLVATKVPTSSKKLESIRLHRQELAIKNESRAIKLQACKILERQGAKYDFKKFNESMDEYLRSRDIHSMFERICEDDEIGKSELDQMTTDEIGDQVSNVIEDTGLDVISKSVDIDDETATVSVRVEDSDEAEVHVSEIEEVLTDVFETPVEINGPYQSEGDKSVFDLAVIINPDASVEEGVSEDDTDKEISSEDDSNNDKKLSSEENKNESVKSTGKRVNEKFVRGTGDVSLFALLSNDSADNDPKFLAQDDSMISGNEDKAEDLARIFVSEDAAIKYLQGAGIEDKFTPVSISVVTNENVNTNDSDDEFDEIETEDGTYFKKDESFYKKDNDGVITECDESEYNDAKATKYELDKIRESYKKSRSKKSK